MKTILEVLLRQLNRLGTAWNNFLPNLRRVLRPFLWIFIKIGMYSTSMEVLQLVDGFGLTAIMYLRQAGASLSMQFAAIGSLLLMDEIYVWLDTGRSNLIIGKLGYPLCRDLKVTALEKFFEMDLPWHESKSSGELATQVGKSVSKIDRLVDQSSWDLFPCLLGFCMTSALMLYYSWKIAILGLIAFIGFLWITFLSFRACKVLRAERHKLEKSEGSRLTELLKAIQDIKTCGEADYLLNQYRQLLETWKDVGTREHLLNHYGYHMWKCRLLSLTKRGIMLTLVSGLDVAQIDMPAMFFVWMLTGRLFDSFWRFGRLFHDITEASEGSIQQDELLGEKPLRIASGTYSSSSTELDISTRGLCFAYNRGDELVENHIEDLHVELPAGSCVAFVGPSGAGKSTIVKLLCGLYPYEGKIMVDGVDIRDWDPKAFERKVSLVSQNPSKGVLSGSVMDAIRFSQWNATDERVIAAAKAAALYDEIMRLPQGFETILGENGHELSGGQLQRLAVARALLDDRASILIFDESTSSLDPKNENLIYEALRHALALGKTVIIIAHRLYSLNTISNKIIVMKQGRKIEEGTHFELIAQAGEYAQLVAAQNLN